MEDVFSQAAEATEMMANDAAKRDWMRLGTMERQLAWRLMPEA